MRHIPAGRIAAVLAVIVGGVVLARGTGQVRFQTIAPGVEFAKLRGDPYCRQGSSDIGVLRVDPARAPLHVRHFSTGGDRPVDIFDWQKRSGAIAVFNAGQYYPDFSYMGLLSSAGTRVSGRLHPTFKAALVAGPVDGGEKARVLDLEHVPLDPDRPRWREIAQSFMLFDRNGVVRVRKSPQIAPRTIVGEDRDGRLLVIASEGSYTLADFAALLQSAPLDLTHAMSMDGGAEAQLWVRAPAFQYASFGHWTEGRGEDELKSAVVPLPAVVTVGGK